MPSGVRPGGPLAIRDASLPPNSAGVNPATLILIGGGTDHSKMNRLYYGDNLTVLRGCISDESVDLIYLDPPFNSQATYNVLFKSTAGEQSRAQIEAFEDTWHWGNEGIRTRCRSENFLQRRFQPLPNPKTVAFFCVLGYNARRSVRILYAPCRPLC